MELAFWQIKTAQRRHFHEIDPFSAEKVGMLLMETLREGTRPKMVCGMKQKRSKFQSVERSILRSVFGMPIRTNMVRA